MAIQFYNNLILFDSPGQIAMDPDCCCVLWVPCFVCQEGTAKSSYLVTLGTISSLDPEVCSICASLSGTTIEVGYVGEFFNFCLWESRIKGSYGTCGVYDMDLLIVDMRLYDFGEVQLSVFMYAGDGCLHCIGSWDATVGTDIDCSEEMTLVPDSCAPDNGCAWSGTCSIV